MSKKLTPEQGKTREYYKEKFDEIEARTSKFIQKDVELKLLELGFRPNSKAINGLRPDFTRGNDVLFLFKKNHYIGRTAKIRMNFKNYNGKVFGVLLNITPAVFFVERDFSIISHYSQLPDGSYRPLPKAEFIMFDPINMKRGIWDPGFKYVDYSID